MPTAVSPSSSSATVRSVTPVAIYDAQTGAAIVQAAVAADGSSTVTGSNGTGRATAANPLNTAVNGVNGTGLATAANPIPTTTNGVNGTGLATAANPFPVSVNGVTATALASATNPVPTRGYGWAAMATGQVSVLTSNTQIVAARAGRGVVRVTNHGTNPVYLGNTGVAVGTGFILPGVVGASVEIPTPAALFGIAGVAQTVSFIELY
jgi:hypothetical protein